MAEFVDMAQAMDGPSDHGLFKALKRKRHYRRRSDEADTASPQTKLVAAGGTDGQETSDKPAPDSEAEITSPHLDHVQGNEDEPSSVAEILRRRQRLRNRRGGIEFANGMIDPIVKTGTPVDEDDSDAGDEPNEASEEIPAIVNRFAPQTGQVADVNQHM